MLFLVLAVSVFAAARLPVDANSKASSSIIWQDASHSKPQFIPLEVLEHGVKSLPGTERLQRQLNRTADANSLGDGTSPCDQPPIGDTFILPGQEKPPPPSISSLLQTFGASFAGRVVGVTPGWRTDEFGGHAASLIAVEVLEVFADRHPNLRPRATVTYLQDSGRFTLGTAMHCTEDPRFQSAKIGDELLIMGRYDNVNPGYIHTTQSGVFFTRDGVASAPRDNPLGASSISIDEIRRHASAGRGVPK